jgi:hypothetical protein
MEISPHKSLHNWTLQNKAMHISNRHEEKERSGADSRGYHGQHDDRVFDVLGVAWCDGARFADRRDSHFTNVKMSFENIKGLGSFAVA